MLHFAEVLTQEGVAALARYLCMRLDKLGPGATAVEVGAGSGRLSHLLNQTGLLGSGRIIPTEPSPLPGDARARRFATEPLDAAAAIAKHRPALVLCAWMEVGATWHACVNRCMHSATLSRHRSRHRAL